MNHDQQNSSSNDNGNNNSNQDVHTLNQETEQSQDDFIGSLGEALDQVQDNVDAISIMVDGMNNLINAHLQAYIGSVLQPTLNAMRESLNKELNRALPKMINKTVIAHVDHLVQSGKLHQMMVDNLSTPGGRQLLQSVAKHQDDRMSRAFRRGGNPGRK